MNRQYAIVIPAYNEASSIRSIAEACLQVCDKLIVVDDGSDDGTPEQLLDLDLTLLKNDQNMGKAASLWKGMEAALAQGASDVITLDGDGQHKAEDLPRMLAAAEKNPDSIIIGSRMANKADFPAKRYYANQVANFWISWAAGYSIEDSQSGFRLYPGQLLRRIDLKQRSIDGFVFESEILIEAAALGVFSVPVPIDAVYHEDARPSHFRGVTDIMHITRMVAWKLISGLGRLPSFYRAFIRPRFSRQRVESICTDGWTMLALSSIVLLLSFGITGLLVFRQVLSKARQTPYDPGPVSCVLVMGMKLHDGKPLPDFRKRLDRALTLRLQDQGKIMVLGGKTSTAAETEGQAGCQYLKDNGKSDNEVLAEGHSRHTLENLQQARKMLAQMGCGTVALISNRYHLARCQAMAAGLDMKLVLCPAEEHWNMGVTTLFKLFKETFFMHWYRTGLYWGRLTANQRIQNKIT